MCRNTFGCRHVVRLVSPELIRLCSLVSCFLLRLGFVLHSARRLSGGGLLLLVLVLFDLQQSSSRIRHHAVLQARQLPVCEAAVKETRFSQRAQMISRNTPFLKFIVKMKDEHFLFWIFNRRTNNHQVKFYEVWSRSFHLCCIYVAFYLFFVSHFVFFYYLSGLFYWS